MKERIFYLTGLIIFFMISCSKDENSITLNQEQLEATVNNSLELPSGSFQINPDDSNILTDDSIEIESVSGSIMPIFPGNTALADIGFNSPNGNITAVGMRFGQKGPINFVPIQTNNAIRGKGSFQFRVTPDICNNLSSICHNISCYEYAYTSEGKISKANITQIALTCGQCDEPSCQSLLGDLCNVDCNDLSIQANKYLEAINLFSDNPTRSNCENMFQTARDYIIALGYCGGFDVSDILTLLSQTNCSDF